MAAAKIKSFFAPLTSLGRKQKVLACTMHLDDPGHIHGPACYIEIAPLSIVEIFQSQGCVATPPALSVIQKDVLASHNVLLLTYAVTHFDGQGWKDTFGNSKWDQRQKEYVKKWGRNQIYTPQVVVDGLADGIGARDGKSEVPTISARAAELREKLPLIMTLEKTGPAEIKIVTELNNAAGGQSSATPAEGGSTATYDILAITYDPRQHEVKVGTGTNKGKKIKYINVVSEIVKVGEWEGSGATEGTVYIPPNAQEGFERVIVVQAGVGGAIMAALKI